jgi:hypothetical protein
VAQPDARVGMPTAVFGGHAVRSGPEPGGAALAGRGATVTTVQQAILDFETRWWQHIGEKDAAIRDAFGLEPVRYYELLDLLLDEPEAMLQAPATISRYRHLRDLRQRREASPR